MKSFGPANPTIIVEPDESVADLPEDYEMDVDNALKLFEECGDIILVRYGLYRELKTSFDLLNAL